MKITEIRNEGIFSGVTNDGIKFQAQFTLWIIRTAWYRGCNMEDLADGYGPGQGTHGDWSGIRDSTHQAIVAMTERAMNFLSLDR